MGYLDTTGLIHLWEAVKEKFTAVESSASINKTTLGVQRKNLLQVTASTQTVNGITFTVNDDGSITANGTCTALMTVFAGSFTAKSGVKYTLSGCPSGGGTSSYGLTARRAEDESIDKADDWGDGKTFTGDGYKYNIRMRIAKGAVLDNIVFHPMVRYADITDDTFEQYKPSVNSRLSALEETDALSGSMLYSGSVGSSEADITIENLSKYKALWAYFDGTVSGAKFAANVIIPIAYLAKSTSNSVKLAGGIPTGAYITSSGPQAPADTNGYVTAKVNGNVLTLTSDGTIGNLTIISV